MTKQQQPEQPQDRLTALYGQIQSGVEKLTTSEAWFDMLSVVAKFPRYSLNNTMLIWLQKPDATMVMAYGNKAGTTGWRSIGRNVAKGQHAIKILAPVKRWVDEIDKQTGEQKRVRKVVGYAPVSVFDVSQTEGKPLPDVAPKYLEGEAPAKLWDAVVKQIDTLGWSVRLEEPGGGANGTSDPKTKTVRIKPDMPPLQQLKTLLHEQAHISLGHTNDMGEYIQHRGRMEAEAESTSFVVMKALDLDASGYSVPYVAHWAGDKPETLREIASRVIREARTTLEPLQSIEFPEPAIAAPNLSPGGSL